MCIFSFDGRVWKRLGGMGWKEWIQIQSANHSDEPLKANIMSAKASIMF